MTLCSNACLKKILLQPKLLRNNVILRLQSSQSKEKDEICFLGQAYKSDEWTNVTPKILSLAERKLHMNPKHPLGLIKQRIVDYTYGKYENVRGNPLFSVHQNLSPIVSLHQNFDSLLVPKDHPSRKKSDSYYLNKDFMLRAHTSAHQTELISMGLDNFLVVGDVYRRDAIDSSHYPAFHQMEGVRLFDDHIFFSKFHSGNTEHLKVFEEGVRTNDKQETHTLDTAKLLEIDLKDCLLGLAKDLFGTGENFFNYHTFVTRIPIYVFYRYRVSMGGLLFSLYSPIMGAGNIMERGLDGGSWLWNSGTSNFKQKWRVQ